MKIHVQKWGNSLALRIPKAVAERLQLTQDSVVELSVLEGKIVLSPVTTPTYTLDELLAEIRPDNLHAEVDTGPSSGTEAW